MFWSGQIGKQVFWCSFVGCTGHSGLKVLHSLYVMIYSQCKIPTTYFQGLLKYVNRVVSPHRLTFFTVSVVLFIIIV